MVCPKAKAVLDRSPGLRQGGLFLYLRNMKIKVSNARRNRPKVNSTIKSPLSFFMASPPIIVKMKRGKPHPPDYLPKQYIKDVWSFQ